MAELTSACHSRDGTGQTQKGFRNATLSRSLSPYLSPDSLSVTHNEHLQGRTFSGEMRLWRSPRKNRVLEPPSLPSLPTALAPEQNFTACRKYSRSLTHSLTLPLLLHYTLLT
eukprot:3820123-Rhodomonas_salina.1